MKLSQGKMKSQEKMSRAKFMGAILSVCIVFSISGEIKAQELVADDTLRGWDRSWSLGLNGSQASYSNWSKGGVDNFSVVGSSEFSALYRIRSYSYGFRLLTNYGQSRLEDEGVRKTDDRLSLRNRFMYDLGGGDSKFSFFTNIHLETQFTDGYDYGAGPDGEDLLISGFMAPAYISENAGLAYVPDEHFSFEAGIGLKQTIVSDTDLSTLYGLEPGERFFNEAGFTLGINYNREIVENMIYSGYVETFSNINRSVRRTDVTFSNRLVGRINNFLNMTLQFDMIYDDDFSDEVQLSQVLSAGLSVNLF
ncbi:MAG: DUF3078 domain-containing protein [Balneolaceae bacterium]